MQPASAHRRSSKRSSIRIRSARVRAVAVLLGLLAFPGFALAETWQLPATDISAVGSYASDPQLAIAPDGVVTAVWQFFNGTDNVIQAARYSGGAWSAPVTLSAPGHDTGSPQVAVTPDGAVTVVWARFLGGGFKTILSKRFTGGAWDPSATSLVAPGDNAGDPQVGAGADGSVMAVWTLESNPYPIIQARRFANGAWEAAPTNLTDSNRPSDAAQVVVAPNGDATAVWTRNDGANQFVQAKRFSGGEWSANTTSLSQAGHSAYYPKAGVADDGTVTVVWDYANGVHWEVQGKRFANGNWDPQVTQLSPAGQESRHATIAVASDGSAVAAWLGPRVQARRFSAGAWEPQATNVAPAGGNTGAPAAAIAPDGSSTVIWEQSSNSDDHVVQAARFSGSSWDPAVNLSGPENGNPRVGASPDGTATAVWSRDDGTEAAIQSSRFAVAPGAPRTVRATAGDGSAAVAWTVPLGDRGAGIASYTATSSPGGKTCTVDAPATSCTVSGLTNGTTYTFTVTARNGIGSSPPSSPSNAVTPTAPESAVPIVPPAAPQMLEVTPGSQSARARWQAPANATALTSYTVTATPRAPSLSLLFARTPTYRAPWALVVDASDNLLVTNLRGLARIVRYNPQGLERGVLDAGFFVQDLVLDKAGNIIATGESGPAVVRLSPSGARTTLASNAGSAAVLTMDPQGNALVPGIPTRMVNAISPQGAVRPLGRTGEAPVGIAVDAQGNIFTANQDASSVTRITPAGLASTFASTGASPRDLVMDQKGNLYTPNALANTVTRITPQGLTSTIPTGGIYPRRIAVESSGDLLVTHTLSATVRRITAAGSSSAFGPTGAEPVGIALDSQGSAFTADAGSDTITKLIPLVPRTCTTSATAPATPATTCVISRLVDGAIYDVTVTATNAAGTSPSSSGVAAAPRVTLKPIVDSAQAAPTSAAVTTVSTTTRSGANTVVAEATPLPGKGSMARSSSSPRAAVRRTACATSSLRATCRLRLSPGRWRITLTERNRRAVLGKGSTVVRVRDARPSAVTG